jgi:glycerol uptake facilitator-like aquaporin
MSHKVECFAAGAFMVGTIGLIIFGCGIFVAVMNLCDCGYCKISKQFQSFGSFILFPFGLGYLLGLFLFKKRFK